MVTKKAGWLPHQHGAWAMLIVPTAVGIVLRVAHDALPRWTVPLVLTWLAGYFAFNTISLWLKAATTRRGRYQASVLTYTGLTGAFAILTLLLGGWRQWGWLMIFAPLVAVALVETAHRRDRSLASGLSTVLAAGAMGLVMRFGQPWQLGRDPQDAITVALVTCYFIGTLLYVKTMIRERDSRRHWVGSVSFHGVCLVLAVTLCALGRTHLGWPLVFLAAVARAIELPRRLRHGQRFTPLQVGIIEMIFTVAVLICAVA